MGVSAVSQAQAPAGKIILGPKGLFLPFLKSETYDPRDILEALASDTEGFARRYFRLLPSSFELDEKARKLVEHLKKPIPEADFPQFLRVLGAVCEQAFIGPKRMLFDISYGCNLDCVYCRRHSPINPGDEEKSQPELEGTFLSLPYMESVLDDAKRLMVEEFLLVGGGEPTIHPQFADLIQAVKSRGFGLNFSTNGLALKPKLVDHILQWGVDNMTISVSGVTPKSYRATHPSKTKRIFDKLFQNFDYLNCRRRELVEKTGQEYVKPFCIFLHVLTRDNWHEVVDMALMGAEYGFDTIWYKLVHPSPWSQHLCLTLEEAAKVREMLKEVKKLAPRLKIKIDSYMDQEINNLQDDGTWAGYFHEKRRCFVGWNFSYVDLSRDFSFCCGDKIVGKADQYQGFADFWLSEEYAKARHCAKNINYGAGNLPTYNGGEIIDEFCRSCDNTNFNDEMEGLLKKWKLESFLGDA